MAEDAVEQLLRQWEQNYKRGLLTFWILLLLHEREMYAYEMRDAIHEMSQGTIMADEKSIYRALRRFSQAGLINSQQRPSPSGPPRRYFTLSVTGRELLAAFVRRNILVFQQPQVKLAIDTVLSNKK